MRHRSLTALRFLVSGALGFVAVGVLVVGEAQVAGACSCAGSSDHEALGRADAVFTGKLVEVVAPPTGGITGSADPERFVFEVVEVFGARDGELYSHLCSGTRAIADGAFSADVVATPPIPTGSAAATTPTIVESAAPAAEENDSAARWPLAGAGLLALVSATWLWRRSRGTGSAHEGGERSS